MNKTTEEKQEQFNSKKLALENSLRKKRKQFIESQKGTLVIQQNIKYPEAGISKKESDEELRQKAKEILLREAKISSERASRMGPQGW